MATISPSEGCGTSTLRIWDFESLTVLYEVQAPLSYYRQLEFSSGGLSIVDLTRHQLRILFPPVLVRQSLEGEASISKPVSLPQVTGSQFGMLQVSKRLNCIAAHPSKPLILASNHSGDVLA